MKKLLAVILSLVYFVAIGGVGMNLHYCCGNLDNVELSYIGDFVTGHDSCSMASVYTGKDCCKKVHKAFKVKQAQNTVSDIACPVFNGFVAILPSFPQVVITPNFPSVARGSFLAHAPPFAETAPVYLKNCSFLI